MTVIRNEFDAVLRQWGHNIYLQRVTNPFDTTKKAIFSNVFEKHTVRRVHPNNLANAQEEGDAGIEINSNRTYYFRWNVNPTPGDRIYENIEGYPNNMVSYIIEDVEPMRGENGKVSFWTVGVTKESPE